MIHCLVGLTNFLNDNLTVDGSQTIINSGTVRIADHQLELGYLNTNDNASNFGGIVLKGAEVKSIRRGGVTLDNSYAVDKKGEFWIINLYIDLIQN